MIKTSIPIAFLLVFAISLQAQTPRNIILDGPLTTNSQLVPCAQNDAGTVSFGPFTGQSNDVDLDTIYLCLGDVLPMLHSGGSLAGDPNAATAPGYGLAFYDCPPVIDGPDITTIVTDNCLNTTSPLVIGGVNFPQTEGIWIAVGPLPNGDILLNNDGSLQEGFNGGNPAPIQFWFAPITIDDFATVGYEGLPEGNCVTVGVDEAFSVVYLEAIDMLEEFPNYGAGLEGGFTLQGGLPEFETNSDYTSITISSTTMGNPGGTVTSTNVGHNDTVVYTVPRPGEYEIVVEDGKSCGLIDTIEMPVIFEAEVANGQPGDTVCVGITVSNFVDITNTQFTLSWDPAILSYIGFQNINNSLPALNSGSFNEGLTAGGLLPFIWFDVLGTTNSLPDGSVMFELCFELIGDLGDSSPVSFVDTPTDIQVGNPGNMPFAYPFELRDGEIFITSSALLVTAEADSVSCAGLSDGAFTVTVSGGAAPYTFTWNTPPFSNPENGPQSISQSGGTATVSGFPAGDYRIIVTDSDMPPNMDTILVEIFQDPEFSVNVAEQSSPLCFGDMNGELIANVTVNGVPVADPEAVFDFQWDVPGETGQVLGGIGTETHAVTVTNANGCEEIDSGSLSQPPPLSILDNNTTIQDATCNGAMDGSILVAATGGTTDMNGNYTYSWSNALGTVTAGTSQVSNLEPGQYFLTVEDANGCMVEDSFTVAASKTLGINLVFFSDVTCNGFDDGTIEVIGTSTGLPPFGAFTYDWELVGPGSMFNGAQITGLEPGQYAITVTDQDPAGCMAVDTFEIAEPELLEIQLEELLNESCNNGGGDGQITITVTGGTYPYAYTWSDMQTDSIAVNLMEGMYTVEVTDDNNCTASETYTITAPTPPAIDMLDNDTLSCPEAMDGTLTVVATPGGSPISTYEWDNGDAGSTITGLGTGTYVVTITAQDGCFVIDTAEVIAPPPLVLDSIVGTSPNCPGDDNGTLAVFVSGGTQPYTYIWGLPAGNDTTTNNLYPGLTAGDYAVTIVDANNCEELITLGAVVDPPSIDITFSNQVDVSCFENVCDGQATASAIYSDGTTGVFEFLWESTEMDSDVSSSTATLLCKDWQTVVVIDGAGCFSQDSVFIDSPDDIVIIQESEDVSCNGQADGSASLTVSGGIGGFTYDWLQLPDNTPDVTGLAAGDYNVVVTDANGCIEEQLIEIGEPAALILSVDPLNTEDASCFGTEDGQLAVQYNNNDLINEVGIAPYTWSSNVPLGSADPGSPVALNLPAGTYGVTITDVEGCQDSLMYTIAEPDEIVVIVPDPEDPLCFNSSTQVFIDTIYGGVGTTLADYQYMVDGNGLLLPPNIPADIFGNGEHTIEAFDQNGCSGMAVVEIMQPEEIIVTFPNDVVVELGDTSVQLQPIITPLGIEIDSFIWTPSEYLSSDTIRNPFVRPLESLDYTLQVVDLNGCTGEGSVFVELDANRNLYIPNVFSPNGDGANDEFRVYPCVGVTTIKSVNIFDRWGNHVFEASDIDVSSGLFCQGGLVLWDGRFKGDSMNKGVYVYVIEAEFLDDISLTYRGDVTILR
jgi:gliding motility-associated-like protein